jgi:hypothetical protein
VHAVARLANKYEMRGVVDIYEYYLLQQDDEQLIESSNQVLKTAQDCGMSDLLQYSARIISMRGTVEDMVKNSELARLSADTMLILFAERLELFEELFQLGRVNKRLDISFSTAEEWNKHVQSVASKSQSD